MTTTHGITRPDPAIARRDRRHRPFAGALRRSRLNRSLSFVLGAALAAAGLLGAATTASAAGAGVPAWFARWPWFAPPPVPSPLAPYALGIAGLTAVLVGAWWLLAQRDTGRLRRVVRGADSVAGLTVVSGRALTDAVSAGVERVPGAVRARARLHGADGAPWLSVEATVSPDTDLAAFVHCCEETVVEALRVSLEVAKVPALVVVAVGGGSTRPRVR
ncbi:hypothetical protein [Nocardiopsis aegyptia]|uniref:Alkaline shock response membrane anchor protein AmaP n=1 Tax=Nocardiopsis aegyptia TaxID=220378 RepID=A0A7Z0EIY5_9ACTN|nr:hypothetical protein [Nocardiopsis aegyptia]NYJ32739.1 hypothetical protein [Nocardiopsis aegyptia]